MLTILRRKEATTGIDVGVVFDNWARQSFVEAVCKHKVSTALFDNVFSALVFFMEIRQWNVNMFHSRCLAAIGNTREQKKLRRTIIRRMALNAARVSASVVDVAMYMSLYTFQLTATESSRIMSEDTDRRSLRSVAKLESTNEFKQCGMSICR